MPDSIKVTVVFSTPASVFKWASVHAGAGRWAACADAQNPAAAVVAFAAAVNALVSLRH